MNSSNINNINFLVCVQCFTFNHAPYIEDAMNGFCMQQTSFPFVCTIIDDASTDGEQNVIKNYLKEHFDLEDKSVVRKEETNDYIFTFAHHKTNNNCYFAVYFLKYNHYSIKKPKIPYIQEWYTPIKYIAPCEGDDYWIDPKKLHKQVDFMESHPDCTMTCSRAKLYSEKQQKYIGESYCYTKSQFVFPKDIIRKGGLFINTCSIIYKKEIKENYPDYCRKCAVGDYPLQIMCVMKGRVYYFDDILSVYRIENSNSWCAQQDIIKNSEKRINTIRTEINMLKGFSKDYPTYSKIFIQRSNFFITQNFPPQNASIVLKESFCDSFKKEICNFNFFWKLKYFLIHHHIFGMNTILKPFLRKYYPHRLYY